MMGAMYESRFMLTCFFSFFKIKYKNQTISNRIFYTKKLKFFFWGGAVLFFSNSQFLASNKNARKLSAMKIYH